jgi:hypothetical protein
MPIRVVALVIIVAQRGEVTVSAGTTLAKVVGAPGLGEPRAAVLVRAGVSTVRGTLGAVSAETEGSSLPRETDGPRDSTVPPAPVTARGHAARTQDGPAGVDPELPEGMVSGRFSPNGARQHG